MVRRGYSQDISENKKLKYVLLDISYQKSIKDIFRRAKGRRIRLLQNSLQGKNFKANSEFW